YYQQGGDMVRVGGMRYKINPKKNIGHRLSELRLSNGQLLSANKTYTVSGWASVKKIETGRPMWTIVSDYLLK
ncbi:MAG: 5'-nucleotidase C-terminal domain-containing protein, partial [Methylococcales bacterium]|nr:5'-nucleotidase C-terminal domain-containing protein [Methylococcales bacterium]